MPQEKQRFYAFGPFLLDTRRHQVLRDTEPVPFTPKTYDALLVLLEKNGALMSKDELMAALWPDNSVEESNLTQQISMIRKALADGAGRDQYIVTVPGRGYRFAAPVRSWSDPADSAADAAVPGPTPVIAAAPPGWPKRILIAAAAVAAAAILIVLIARRPAAVPKSMAVLPFQNLRQDPSVSFLGFSLADAIITKLDYVNSLTVRPSYAVEKYRNASPDLRTAARDLHVQTLLTGSYLREGDDLRITAQLIDVEPQKILWRNTFDVKLEKLLAVQDNVVRQIISGLALSLSPSEGERLQGGKPVDPAAYEYYLRGVDQYARGDFPMAIRMLEKSSEIDGSYALTWAQLGRSYTANASFQLAGREEYGKAQRVYEKALSLQPEQIEAHIYMANFFTDIGRVEQAVPLLKKALHSNPNHAEAHWELGYAYRFAGMLNESEAECERARLLDPNVKITSSAPNAYLYTGQYDKFLDRLPKNSDAAFIVFYRGFAEYYKKNWSQAAAYFDRAFELDPSLLHAAVGRALAFGIRQENRKGVELLRETEAKIEQRGVGDPEAMYKIAQAYAVLGDRISALRALGRSVANGFFSYPYMANDPLLDGLRQQIEFTRLMDQARERHEKFKHAWS